MNKGVQDMLYHYLPEDVRHYIEETFVDVDRPLTEIPDTVGRLVDFYEWMHASVEERTSNDRLKVQGESGDDVQTLKDIFHGDLKPDETYQCQRCGLYLDGDDICSDLMFTGRPR